MPIKLDACTFIFDEKDGTEHRGAFTKITREFLTDNKPPSTKNDPARIV